MLAFEARVDLLRACQVLFDSSIRFSDEFIRSLEPATLKLAYRKKVFETHPDRSRAVGKTESEMNLRFREVSLAYERLMPYVAGIKPLQRTIRPAQPPPQKPQPPPKRHSKDHFYTGKLPEYELKFGQFVYYSGQISWRMLIRAIVWQKRQRPLFGQIAQHWGFLSPSEVQAILRRKPYHEKFGEFALRTGHINLFQKLAVIGRQKLSQPLIGRFFLLQDILSEEQLNHFLQQAFKHNQRLRNKKRFTG
jgi:hypothetical protein